ncbi:MarR family winged helix-turn-helix transcriptional regulator [Puia sp.]|jgi:DNA-binding MarR family transcriptional regulator|uniref:MarR family winged helix-turn-helix transcriptional regulator n=1 Tax=Puia sp. TaxID=2045100 RepID=UPI002F3E51EA
MAADKKVDPKVYDLMWALRKFTRSSLLLQHTIAQQTGLHVTDAECIDFLQEMGPSTAGALAKATKLTTGAITNVIDRLEKSGFVKRTADPNDRRKVIVTLIPEKHAKTRQHYIRLAAQVEQLFRTYDEKDLSFLIRHTEALDLIYREQAEKIDPDVKKS